MKFEFQVLNQAIDTEGFIQSPNSRHRPVASPRKGIFFAGSCHDENNGDDLAAEISAILAGLSISKKMDLLRDKLHGLLKMNVLSV